MDKKSEFKEFVKEHPSLIKFVRTGDMNWQKFYELYDLYGGEGEAWIPYVTPQVAEKTATAAVGTTDFLGWLKQIDLDSVQSGINSLQRVLSVVTDLKTPETKKPEYKPRPLYKHFED